MADERYFRRFRMEIDLKRIDLPECVLPEGYFWNSWRADLLERHAEAKYGSFQSELDSKVFPCLGDSSGCFRLMSEIASQSSFLPETTWLVSYRSDDDRAVYDIGTIQGIAHTSMVGAIQNVGVVAAHRGMGLGRALVLKSLRGFQQLGIFRVSLEVTAENTPAVKLYRSLGFQIVRTMYRNVEPTTADAL